MKKLFILFTLLMGSLTFTEAQSFPGIDKSPLDVSFWRTARNAPAKAKVVYSRPMQNDREIWGSLVPFGKMWRTGANEATEITFYEDVDFGGTPVTAGTYSLYTIPEADKITFVLNKKVNTWGAYQYDETMDVARVAGIAGTNAEAVEAFSMIFENQEDGSTHLVMGWADKNYRVPIK